MHSTRLQNTTNDHKPKPRSNNQTSRSLSVSKSSCVTSKVVPLVDHSRNSSLFSYSKHFVCSTCHKCVFNANHDACITKLLKEVNSRANIQSHKTRNYTKPVEPTSRTQKPSRQIVTRHRFSPNTSSTVHEKPNTPRSCLKWKPTGRIFKTAGLRWIPTGKIFTSNTTKVDSEPLNGSNEDITNPYECQQTLNVSAGTLNLSACTPFNPNKERLRVWLLKKLMSKNQEPQGIHKHEQSLNSAQCVNEQQQRAYFDDPFLELLHKISGLYTLRLLDAACKKVLNLLKKGLLKGEAILKSAWTEKDQIDNFLKEGRLMRSLEILLVTKSSFGIWTQAGSKHMTGDRSRLMNFVKKFIGTVRFGNDHFGAIMGYGDYVVGDSVISRVYYVEGLGHNLFSVGQFCDSDLEVAFRKHSCYVRDTDGVELLKGSRGSNLYTISVEDMMKSSPICLLSKASKHKSWLWHRRLNHLNFGTINDLARKDLVRGLPRLKFEKDHLCSACQLGKSKKHTHKPKTENTNLEVLNTLHMDLCGPMRVQTINGKKYILVIVDDYSRFTWVKFLRSKDETPTVVIKFLKQIQVGLNKTVRFIRTDNGTEFVNKTLYDYYESVGIFHQKTVPRTPQQNGVVERRNRTLVEAARTMLIFSKAPMFLWAEAVATACYTQNRSLIHTRHDKTPYELVHNKKPDLTFFRVFGALCYPTNDSEDLGKLQPTADIGIFVGYAPSRKDFLKLVDSLDLDGANRERTRLRLFQFSLRDQASNWLERLPAGSITTWEDLTTHFLAQFFPLGRTAKHRNDILMFQQHQGESLSLSLKNCG
ncbi:retrovirus-related pol polyprotein from transposon TNT 1-94 [Tanacetum coccineum]|uniref:Retrovirus-related pol polyprotein from transposon TNT 1-94 n=2 Tax=Tanacetum coccineum TaxID=301880 RepID=A0ABQ5CSY1_9ASTR